MRLRTLAGAYAGEIRDYTFSAGQAALKVGTAERIDQADTRTRQAATPVANASVSPVSARKATRPRR